MGELSVREIFGLVPLGEALQQGLRGLRGDPYTPKHAFGVSSLKILDPVESVSTWLGKTRGDRRIPIYNFFNREPIPPGSAHSVRKTFARDFRGRDKTYDGHKGTDFIVPVGTVVTAAAPGRVLRVAREFDRGGLHVMIDHGEGLITTASHLARPLVEEGQDVARGEPVALAGAAGMDFLLLFPWTTPHVHYNTWLDGAPADPFAKPGEVSLWREPNWPEPWQGPEDREFTPTEWEPELIEAAVAQASDPEMEGWLREHDALERRAAEVIFQRILRPTRFHDFPPVYKGAHPRKSHLSLPFRSEDFDGVHYEP